MRSSLDIWNHKGFECPNHKFPPTQLPQSNNPAYQGDQLRTCLSPSSRFQSAASPWTYSNKPITSSYRKQGAPHPLDTTKPASHCPRLFSVLLCDPVWHAVGCESVTNKLLSASSVQCWLSWMVRIPITQLQGRNPSLAKGANKRWLKHVLLSYALLNMMGWDGVSGGTVETCGPSLEMSRIYPVLRKEERGPGTDCMDNAKLLTQRCSAHTNSSSAFRKMALTCTPYLWSPVLGSQTPVDPWHRLYGVHGIPMKHSSRHVYSEPNQNFGLNCQLVGNTGAKEQTSPEIKL